MLLLYRLQNSLFSINTAHSEKSGMSAAQYNNQVAMYKVSRGLDPEGSHGMLQPWKRGNIFV